MRILQSIAYISGIILMCTALNAYIEPVEQLSKEAAIAQCQKERVDYNAFTETPAVKGDSVRSCQDSCTGNHGYTLSKRCEGLAKLAFK